MKRIPPQYLAWFLWAFYMGLAGVIILVEDFLVPSLQNQAMADHVALMVAFTAMATVGAIVASRRPENTVAWLLLFIPFAAVTAEVASIYSGYAILVRPGALPGAVIVALLVDALWLSLFGQLVFVTLLFPSGTLPSPRWRWVAWGLVGAFAALILPSFFSPEVATSNNFPPVRNPLAIAGAKPILDALQGIATVAILILWGAAAISLVLRFVRSRADERQQMKWFAYTTTIFAVFMITVIIADVTGHQLPEPWGGVLFASFLLLLPLGMGVAILRYRLYDIDLIINRTLVYVPLSAILAGLYIAMVGVMKGILGNFSGGGSDAAVALTTITVVALLTPLKNYLQAMVDRYFKEAYSPMMELDKLARESRPVVQVLDVEQYTRNFLERAAVGLNACGAAVYLHSNGSAHLAYCCGETDFPPVLTLPLLHNGSEVGVVKFGPRRNGRIYTAAEQKLLAGPAGVFAQIIALRSRLP